MRVAESIPVSRFAALVWTLAQRDLKARFKGTLLGWLWSLIVPLASLGLYALVFGVIFRAQVQPLGNGHPPVYVLWLFIGLVAFNFFGNGMMRSAESLRNLAGVLNRVRLPVLAPMLASLLAVGLQSLVELALCLVVLCWLLNVGWTWLLLPLWMALFFIFTAGISAAMAVFSAHFQDVMQFMVVLLQFLFFATPVMYPLSMIPDDIGIGGLTLAEAFAASPISQFLEMARSLLYDLQPGSLDRWLVLLAFASIALAVGAASVARYGPDVAEKLQ